MSKPDDLRLIEDYLPIEAISAEASREKTVRKGHISTLHLWWARRPLVACRAAVYGALVPADRWVREVELKAPSADAEKASKAKNGKKKGLNRKAAKEFVTKLCRYPKPQPTKPQEIKAKRETEAAIVEAQRHILEAHADRLSEELAEAKKSGKPPAWVDEFMFTADSVTYDDIVAGRAPRPRVLDMFAGGGAIPLEALRLGCEAYALDLNPVAHIIQLCTLVYPQKYGKPDLTARGMTGPKITNGESTWGGLTAEVGYWGNWVLDRVRKEIGDLYPPIADPAVWATPPEIAFDHKAGQWNVTKPGKLKRGVTLDTVAAGSTKQPQMYEDDEDDDDEVEDGVTAVAAPVPPGFLVPLAYLWTRTVRCKNPGCGAEVPLVKQTWLCKRQGRNVALQMIAQKGKKEVRFDVVESETEKGLGFDPTAFSKAGNATCPFCGTVADSEYVKVQGCSRHLGEQVMAVVCTRPMKKGKVYFDIAQCLHSWPTDELMEKRAKRFIATTGIKPPYEPIVTDAKNSCWTHLYGLTSFGDLFNKRQTLCLLTFVAAIKSAHREMMTRDPNRDNALVSLLACWVDRLADFGSTLCTLKPGGERGVVHSFTRQAIPMVWDYAEANPLGSDSANAYGLFQYLIAATDAAVVGSRAATVMRGTALEQPLSSDLLDAVITDPPYYDNVPYSNISDFFYVWMRRSIGDLFPEHFSGEGTPKKGEAVADAIRHGGDRDAANKAYESMMARSLREAHRVLKRGGNLVVVYAHKTTLGWSTLVEALRLAGFVVNEAWPFDTEMKTRMRGMDSAALASSIFLVARKREANTGVGNYEADVQPELQQIVRERVETLWDMGIAGADLVIACVGAGLRAFTKYETVEYANGEEVPAEKFLAEVEGAVLDTMMGKLFGQAGSVSAIDPASRFYILWRFVYKASEIEAGEAIVFTYAQHVELDGQQGLSTGKDALVEKKKAKYRARDFTERGDDDKLGLPTDDGKPVPLIDTLHRVLWLMENRPRKLAEFLNEADPDRERLRVLAQALVGAALSGKTEEDVEKLVGTTAAEKAALGKLLANWRSVIDNAVESATERSDRKRGQQRLDLK